MTTRTIGIAAALATALATSAPAWADAPPTSGTTANADRLFVEAKELRTAGRLAEACAKFDESKRVAPGVGVALHLGDCYERLGRTASAWATFLEAETLAHARSDKREPTAHKRAAALETKLNRVTFDVTPAAKQRDVSVRVDGGEVVPAPYWSIGVALDPGRHVVRVDLQGRPRRSLTVTIDVGRLVTQVVIDDGAPPPTAPAAPATASAAPAPHAPEAPPTLPASPRPAVSRRTIELGLLGVAAVGFGTGAVLLAAKNASATNPPDGAPAYDHTAGSASAVAFAIGATAVVSAVVLYLSAPASTDVASVLSAPGVVRF
jgi:hypothetical protein